MSLPIVDQVTVTAEDGVQYAFYEQELAASYAAELNMAGRSCVTVWDYADETRSAVFHIFDPADGSITVVAVPEYPAKQGVAA